MTLTANMQCLDRISNLYICHSRNSGNLKFDKILNNSIEDKHPAGRVFEICNLEFV
jgi:hypothetical protein